MPTRNGIQPLYRAEKSSEGLLLTFVPLEDPCEINRLTLTNDSEQEKTIQLFSYLNGVSGMQMMI